MATATAELDTTKLEVDRIYEWISCEKTTPESPAQKA